MFFSWKMLLRAVDYNFQPVSFIQPKADGLRLLVGKQGQSITAHTREGKTDFWPQLSENTAEWVERVKEMPTGTCLDCELHVPGVQATDVKTLILARDNRLNLTPFAVPFYCGNDQRGSMVWTAMAQAGAMGFEHALTRDIERAALEPDGSGRLTAWAVEELKRMAVNNRLEGYVVKLAHYDKWYKIKPVKSVDCFVVKTTKSISDSFAGGLKSITVAVYHNGVEQVIADVGCGFTADYRMSVDMKSLKGQVCEVSYDSLAGKGKLKFPRFIRWRDDKSQNLCTSEQLSCDLP